MRDAGDQHLLVLHSDPGLWVLHVLHQRFNLQGTSKESGWAAPLQRLSQLPSQHRGIEGHKDEHAERTTWVALGDPHATPPELTACSTDTRPSQAVSAQRFTVTRRPCRAFQEKVGLDKKDFPGQKVRGQHEMPAQGVRGTENSGHEAGTTGEARSQWTSNATPRVWVLFQQLFLRTSIIWPAFWKWGLCQREDAGV